MCSCDSFQALILFVDYKELSENLRIAGITLGNVPCSISSEGMGSMATGQGHLRADLPTAWPVALPPFLCKYLIHHLVGQLAGCLGVVGADGIACCILGRKHLAAFHALQHGCFGHEKPAAVHPGLQGAALVSLVLPLVLQFTEHVDLLRRK